MSRLALTPQEQRFDAKRRIVGLVVTPIAFAALWAMPMPGLSEPAHRLAAVATATVILWVTEAIPLAATALLGPALAVVLAVAPAKEAFAPFADPLIFLFLGGFLLAGGLTHQGFDRRAALWLLARPIVAGSPARALTAVAVITWGFSMWISNTATTAMMIPIALGLHGTMLRVVDSESDARHRLDHYAGGMCLTIAYAANVGGVATPIGTGPNVIALGLLEEMTGLRIDFFQWMVFALPTSTVALAVLLIYARKVFPPPLARIEGLTAEVERQLRALGPLSRGERRAVAVFGLAIAGWLLPSVLRLTLGLEHPATAWARESLREGVVAIVAACLLFFIPSGRAEGERLLTWERAERIDWGTLFLLGGGLALGKMVFTTGLAEAIGQAVLATSGSIAAHPLGLMAVATLLVIYMTEITSNSATTSMMLPVLVGVALASGMDATPTALCVTMAASFAFMLPVSTPPNAMAYGTGLLRIDTMIRAGFRLDLIGFALLMIVGTFLLPLVLN